MTDLTDVARKSVVITGAAGHLGRHVAAAFRAAGWRTRGVDLVAAPEVETVDLRDPVTARDRLAGADAVVHCAALPRPVGHAADDVFAVNMALMHGAVSAAEATGARLVYASSYSVIGLPFAPRPVRLRALPVTEAEAPAPQDIYATTKWLGEEMIEAMVRRTGLSAISLRLPWVHTAESFAREVLPIRDDPGSRVHLWAWIDAEDAGRAFVAAAQAQVMGHERLFLSAAETFSTRPSADLVAEGWPEAAPWRRLEGGESLIDARRAREVIGFAPTRAWRDYEGVS